MLSFEVQGRLRSPEWLSLPLTIASFSPFLTLETYCATLTGSSSDVTYDRTHFVPQADAARTDAIFTGIRPRLLQKLLHQKIYKNKYSCEQYPTQGSRTANKTNMIFASNLPFKFNFCTTRPTRIKDSRYQFTQLM